jgi:hypothetical protein
VVDRAKLRDDAKPHDGNIPRQPPPNNAARVENDAADQNDYCQSSADLGHGTQHCAIVVLVEKPENHRKPAKGEDTEAKLIDMNWLRELVIFASAQLGS